MVPRIGCVSTETDIVLKLVRPSGQPLVLTVPIALLDVYHADDRPEQYWAKLPVCLPPGLVFFHQIQLPVTEVL